MMFTVYRNSFKKDIKKVKNKRLLKSLKEKILEIKRASSIDEIKNIKKLKGHHTAYRIRIGDYRVGLFYDENNNQLHLARFIKRNDIYKLFP